MSEHIDDLAMAVAERATRRSAVAGLGTLALGALGIAGLREDAEAKKNNNECQRCKRKCRKNNKKPGKKNKTNCNRKCNNKCKNK
jgi:hypothetical protein